MCVPVCAHMCPCACVCVHVCVLIPLQLLLSHIIHISLCVYVSAFKNDWTISRSVFCHIKYFHIKWLSVAAGDFSVGTSHGLIIHSPVGYLDCVQCFTVINNSGNENGFSHIFVDIYDYSPRINSLKWNCWVKGWKTFEVLWTDLWHHLVLVLCSHGPASQKHSVTGLCRVFHMSLSKCWVWLFVRGLPQGWASLPTKVHLVHTLSIGSSLSVSHFPLFLLCLPPRIASQRNSSHWSPYLRVWFWENQHQF